MIFNLIAQYGCLPSVWKSALVTPIFKKGVSSDAGNYRPISLTCVASKIFEQIIKREIMKHLDNHNKLFSSKHTFREKHSTHVQTYWKLLGIGRAILNKKVGHLWPMLTSRRRLIKCRFRS